MMRLRKYILPFMISFVLLLTFGGRGYDCVSDDISLEEINSEDHLKMLSGVICILGEGASFHKKSITDFGQKNFPIMDYAVFDYPFSYLFRYISGNQIISSVRKLPYTSHPSTYIFISVFRI